MKILSARSISLDSIFKEDLVPGSQGLHLGIPQNAQASLKTALFLTFLYSIFE
jgi:hypothetical protein